jgi:uncharacterized protein with PIN domain
MHPDAPRDSGVRSRKPVSRQARTTLRFYAELNDFLPAERRQRDIDIGFVAPVPARHLIELCGVPHTEVELIMRAGESLGLESAVHDGDRLAVYPMFEAFDVHGELRLRPQPLRHPRFIADAHLARLARDLRMLGFDTLWENDLGDADLARVAAAEHRVLLTSDRQLLMRRQVTHGCYLRPADPQAQLAYLVERLQLCGDIRPFTRCTACNQPVEPVPCAAVRDAVPPGVRRDLDAFWRCTGCGRVYWQGSHWQAMAERVSALCPSWRDGDAAP